MSNTTIKRIDLSQIRYEPKEGEVAYNTQETNKGYFIYHDGSWMKLNTDSSGLNLGLYDLNKQIIDQLPILSEKELSDKKAVIN